MSRRLWGIQKVYDDSQHTQCTHYASVVINNHIRVIVNNHIKVVINNHICPTFGSYIPVSSLSLDELVLFNQKLSHHIFIEWEGSVSFSPTFLLSCLLLKTLLFGNNIHVHTISSKKSILLTTLSWFVIDTIQIQNALMFIMVVYNHNCPYGSYIPVFIITWFTYYWIDLLK